MKPHKPIYLFCSATMLLCLAVSPAFAQTQADNSAANKNQTATADSQSSVQSDRTITRKIRQAIIADKGLSTYAHNVKIITVNGGVTLKGSVHSDEEKSKIVADAGSVISADAITNELTVKGQ